MDIELNFICQSPTLLLIINKFSTFILKFILFQTNVAALLRNEFS